ncbi:MAG: hypothetical protein R3E88_04845 [Myxococcota bacterium]
MRSSIAVLALAIAAIAAPASAVVKTYNSTPPNGTAGDELQYSVALCPPIQSSAGLIQGDYKIDDNGGGTVTLNDFNLRRIVNTNFGPVALVPIFGPGSYVFTTSDSTRHVTLGTTHTGSTAPGGSVDWGILAGWTVSGQAFCISSPQTICTQGTQVPHGQTQPSPDVNSPTYDLGTWAFDAEGDFQAASPYINQTNNGGTSNRQFLLRGAFVGGGVPALPLLGAGALAIGLLVAGSRTVLRKK